MKSKSIGDINLMPNFKRKSIHFGEGVILEVEKEKESDVDFVMPKSNKLK